MIAVDQKVYEMKDAGFQTRKNACGFETMTIFLKLLEGKCFFQWDDNIELQQKHAGMFNSKNLKIGSLEPSYVWITLTRALVSPHRWLKLYFFYRLKHIQTQSHNSSKRSKMQKPNITRGTRRENAEHQIESRPSRMNKMENYCIHAH